MILPSARRAELQVRRDDDKCNSLRSTKNHFRASLSCIITSAKEANNWRIEGEKKRITRKEYQRLLKKCLTEERHGDKIRRHLQVKDGGEKTRNS